MRDAAERNQLCVHAKFFEFFDALFGGRYRRDLVIARMDGKHRHPPSGPRGRRDTGYRYCSAETLRIFTREKPGPSSTHAEAGDDDLLQLGLVRSNDRVKKLIHSPVIFRT